MLSPSRSFSRIATPLTLVCTHTSDPEMLSQYFDLLDLILDENGLKGKPGKVFNMDKSSMSLDPKAPRIVVQRGSSAVGLGSGNRSQVTIAGCCRVLYDTNDHLGS